VELNASSVTDVGPDGELAERGARGGVDLVVGALVVGFVVSVGLVNGGFFPQAWSWALFSVAWVLAMAALAGVSVRLGPLEVWAMAGLASVAGWTLLSAAWSIDAPSSVREAERALLYVVVVALLLVLAHESGLTVLLGSLLIALLAVTGYALIAYLFLAGDRPPDRFEGYLLFRPVGYANAVGVLAAIGIALSIGLFLEVRRGWLRGVCVAALVPLAAALELSSGRAAWFALLVALGVMVLAQEQPRQVAAKLSILAVAPLLAVVLSRQADLQAHTALFRAGHAERLGVELLLLTLATALLADKAAALTSRATVRRQQRRWWAAGSLCAIGVFVLTVLMESRHLGDRLAINDRSVYWHVAWHEWRGHWLLGSGAGTFAHFWQFQAAGSGAQDAHSLYLETLAELGIPGFCLLLTAVVVPLVAAFIVRDQPVVRAALAGYVVFLIHAGLDWDWEMPVVTVSGLVCAIVLLVAARSRSPRLVSLRPALWMVAPIGALLAISAVTLVANGALR
jgi:hypothetical protein